MVPTTDPHPVIPWLTTARRGWLYRVLTAAGLVAVTYGLMTGEELAVWLGVVAAVSNVTPAAHTTTKAPAP